MKKRIKKINIIFCIFCIFFVSCADENITKESVVEVFFTPTAIASSKVQLIPSPSPKTIPKKESSPILEKSKIKAESSTLYNSKKTYFIATDNDKEIFKYSEKHNNKLGLSIKIPIEWDEKKISNGFLLKHNHADFRIKHFENKNQSLLDFSQKYLGEIDQYVEKKRKLKSELIISEGNIGRAYYRFIFLINGINDFTIMTFSANPDFLDDYISVFDKIQNSISITHFDITKPEPTIFPTPTVTIFPTPTPTIFPTPTVTIFPTPTPTILPKKEYLYVDGDKIPSKTLAGTNICNERYVKSNFCIEILIYEGVSFEQEKIVLDGLDILTSKYFPNPSKLNVSWPMFGPSGGNLNYIGVILWNSKYSSREDIANDFCKFRTLTSGGPNIKTNPEECIDKHLQILGNNSAGDGLQKSPQVQDNGYFILLGDSVLQEPIQPSNSPPGAKFNDPRKVVAHEYFHSYQTSHAVRMRGGSDGASFEEVTNIGPVWLVEGGAEYAAIKAASVEGWMDWESQMRQRIENSKKILEQYPNFSIDDNSTRAQKAQNEAISQSLGHTLTYIISPWAISYAISLSSHDSVMIDYWEDLEEFGYEESFRKNIGISLEEFYLRFRNFKTKSTDDQMEIIIQQQ